MATSLTRRWAHSGAAIATAIGLAAGASACGAYAPSTSPTTTGGSTSTSPAAVSPGSSANPVTTDTTTSNAGTSARATSAVACATAQLRVTLALTGEATTLNTYALRLQNTGGRACKLGGYPGVAFVTAKDGSQVGASAHHSKAVKAAAITLSPGKGAYSTLGIGDAGVTSDCQTTPVAGLRVYPPNQTAALYLPLSSAQACANLKAGTLSVAALRPGSGPKGVVVAGSSASTTGASKATTCSAADLRFLFDRTTGAAGTGLLLLGVRNTTAQPCALAGYFGISLYSSTGRLLTGTDHREAKTPGGAPARTETVTLKPGGAATTATAFSDSAPTGSGITCRRVAAAQLIPPNETGHGTVPIPRTSRPLFCSSTRAPIDVFVTRPGPPPANYR